MSIEREVFCEICGLVFRQSEVVNGKLPKHSWYDRNSPVCTGEEPGDLSSSTSFEEFYEWRESIHGSR